MHFDGYLKLPFSIFRRSFKKKIHTPHTVLSTTLNKVFLFCKHSRLGIKNICSCFFLFVFVFSIINFFFPVFDPSCLYTYIFPPYPCVLHFNNACTCVIFLPSLIPRIPHPPQRTRCVSGFSLLS